jgi:hypothetical protein
MSFRLAVGAVMLLALPGLAAAQTMNAEEFHKSAVALQNKGAMAVFSMGKVKALMAEAKAAGENARRTRVATISQGKKPRYCPPDGPRTMSSSEFMNRLSAIPAGERVKIDMTEAMTRILEAKFPCGS